MLKIKNIWTSSVFWSLRCFASHPGGFINSKMSAAPSSEVHVEEECCHPAAVCRMKTFLYQGPHAPVRQLQLSVSADSWCSADLNLHSVRQVESAKSSLTSAENFLFTENKILIIKRVSKMWGVNHVDVLVHISVTTFEQVSFCCLPDLFAVYGGTDEQINVNNKLAVLVWTV